jgi:PAS domain S-box-containing protein
MTPWRGHSLRWRLSALVSILITAAIATSLVATYSAVKQVLLRVGGERAVGATDQLATLLSTGNRQRLAELHREAANAAYAACLADASDPNRALAETRLRSLVTVGQQVIELWTATGTRVLTVASPARAATALPDGEPPRQGGLRLAETAAHVVVSESIEPVGGAGGSAPVGFILIRRAVSSSANSDALGRLMGDGARVLLGSTGGGPWTDLSRLVQAPPLDQPHGTSFVWKTTSGEWRLGAVAAVPGTSWLVSVDFPRAAVLRPLWSFVRDISLIGLLFVALSVVIGRVAMGRVIRPLDALTKASEAIASGDYSARVAEVSSDELGRLGSAFNAMTSEVEAGRTRLEARVRERTDALEALRHSEARHRAIVSVAFDSIITIDVAGRVTEFNPTAERTFGYARSEALGRELADLIVPPQHRDAHRTGLARYAATGHGPMIGRLLELTAMRSDGSEFPVEFAIQPVLIEGQTSFTAYLRDLTERRRADELRLKSLRLEAENRRVREASRMKSEFLANMSHELRTPLNAIIGFSTILREASSDVTPEQRVEFLGDILTSGRHLLQLINDVLDLSKVEAGKLEFRPEPVEIDRVVREVLSVLKEAAASKGLGISVDVEPLTDVYLDAGRLKQVLYNYVSNALKFTPATGRVIIRTRAEGAAMWRLEVEDSGIGIAEQDLRRLFVEFEQVDASTAKQHGGTGLGLALTKRLIEAQGGQVGVRSTLGQGSVFWATLPLVYAGPAERTYPALITGGHGPAILVIEDDPKDRAELVDALTAAGFSVEAVTTGSEAIRRAEERAFAAITLDLLLPDQSGLDVLRQIRERGRNPDARVIVVTVVAERHALAGHLVADILPKPLEVSALLTSLRRAGVVPGKEVRIVVVDDDAAAVRLARAVLEAEGFVVDGHTDPAVALAAATASRPSAVVLDLLMPGMDGFQFLDELRRTRNNVTTPVIVWTAKVLSEAEQHRLSAAARVVVHKGPGAAGLVSELQAMLAPAD